jgi:phospholipid/cholesterol/gamma-HCH transport system substrate-binding protein
METRARYVLIGIFTVIVIAAVFAFVFWMNYSGGLSQRTAYRIQFSAPVSGLMPGSSVTFNGINVGEVTAVGLASDKPRSVDVAITVRADTPVRADTHIGVDFRGLTGAPTIALVGGAADAPPLKGENGQPPVLTADDAATQDLTSAARVALGHLDQILLDNADPVKQTIASLQTFSETLARNSDKIDGILDGLQSLTGGGKPKVQPQTFDLTAPTDFTRVGAMPDSQLALPEPTAVVTLNTQRIIVRENGSEAPAFDGTQWSDALPILIQARLVQAFENAGYAGAGRSDDLFTAENHMQVDIRAFQVDKDGDKATARIEVGIKVLGDGGKVIAAKVFTDAEPVATFDAATTAAALNTAFGKVASAIVPFAIAALDQEGDAAGPAPAPGDMPPPPSAGTPAPDAAPPAPPPAK